METKRVAQMFKKPAKSEITPINTEFPLSDSNRLYRFKAIPMGELEQPLFAEL